MHSFILADFSGDLTLGFKTVHSNPNVDDNPIAIDYEWLRCNKTIFKFLDSV